MRPVAADIPERGDGFGWRAVSGILQSLAENVLKILYTSRVFNPADRAA